jgi:hypothetical protein
MFSDHIAQWWLQGKFIVIYILSKTHKIIFWSCSSTEGALNVAVGGNGVSGNISINKEIELLARAESQ